MKKKVNLQKLIKKPKGNQPFIDAGIQFEEDVVKKLKGLGVVVQHTGGMNDFGADVRFSFQGKSFVGQCKLTPALKSFPLQGAYAVLAAKAYYKADFAIAISNTMFAPDIMHFAQKTNIIMLNKSWLKNPTLLPFQNAISSMNNKNENSISTESTPNISIPERVAPLEDAICEMQNIDSVKEVYTVAQNHYLYLLTKQPLDQSVQKKTTISPKNVYARTLHLEMLEEMANHVLASNNVMREIANMQISIVTGLENNRDLQERFLNTHPNLSRNEMYGKSYLLFSNSSLKGITALKQYRNIYSKTLGQISIPNSMEESLIPFPGHITREKQCKGIPYDIDSLKFFGQGYPKLLLLLKMLEQNNIKREFIA